MFKEWVFAPAEHRDQAGLYVHVPFCSAICPYCDFAVVRGRAEDHEEYLKSLLTEVECWSAPDVVFDTVYFGGGTPSALLPEQIERIVCSLAKNLRLSEDVHVTLEANPEDVYTDRALAWRELGVTVVSLGVQSLNDVELKFLGRRHSRAEGLEALAILQSVGFDSVSLDLIYGLPNSRREEWREHLALLPELDHMSCYELTIHEGTPFAKFESAGRLRQIDDGDKAAWFSWVRESLEELGLCQYEVSNFARDGVGQSRHNSKYWRGHPYLGLGPAAHSFDGWQRWANQASWKVWAEELARGAAPVAMRETLTSSERVLEDVMLRLRTREGIDLEQFEMRHGFDLLQSRRDVVTRGQRQGLLTLDGGHLRPTPAGLLVADRLAIEFT